jgi:hypothetical protein
MTGIAGPQLGVDFDMVDTVPHYSLGKIEQGMNGAFYQYIKAGAALTRYLVYIIDQTTFTATNALTQTNDDTSPIALGIPQMSGGIASASYGWVFVGPGPCQVRALINCAQDVLIYSTATAGKVDDTSASSKVIQGLKVTTTITAETDALAAASQKIAITT